MYIGWYPSTKRKPFFAAGNCRGVRLAAQLSKVAERLPLPLVEPHISRTVAFGPNQFANTKGRGARDALAYFMMSWLLALNRRMKIAVYCTDVSGAEFGPSVWWRNSEAREFTPKWSLCGFLAAATYCTGGRGWQAL